MTTTLEVEYDQIFIIDCLPEEQYNKYEISQDLMQFLADNGIQQSTSICRNKKLVISTLNHLVELSASGTKFCIHIVSHGDATGLWIETTKEEILWEDLRSFLKDINTNMGKTLTVNMTSCLGLHGIKIIDESSETLPFFGLVGYSIDLPVPQAKKINHLFYQKLLDGKQINTAVEEIKTDLSDSNIYCISAIGYKEIKNTLSRHR